MSDISACMNTGLLRSRSRSSILKTSSPPTERTASQDRKNDQAFPRCASPVGLGASLPLTSLKSTLRLSEQLSAERPAPLQRCRPLSSKHYVSPGHRTTYSISYPYPCCRTESPKYAAAWALSASWRPCRHYSCPSGPEPGPPVSERAPFCLWCSCHRKRNLSQHRGQVSCPNPGCQALPLSEKTA